MEEKELIVLTPEIVQSRIYVIRGQQVMLDVDLAEIYGYETKNFNRQVKNNLQKFEGDDFMFRLSREELEELSRCKNFTLNKGSGRGSNIKYAPYAFTEQGIYMLMTVLKGELAVRQSRALVRLFKQMKDLIVENQDVLGHKALLQLATQTNQNTEDIAELKDQVSTLATKEDLKKVMDQFIDPDTYKHFLILDGKKVEADLAYAKIYKSARKTIYVVDNYISLKTLELLRSAKASVQIVIFSDNLPGRNKLTTSNLKDFRTEYPDLQVTFKITGGKVHDRYIFIDSGTDHEVLYHCGASSKDAGTKITTITQIGNTGLYHPMFATLMKQANLAL